MRCLLCCLLWNAHNALYRPKWESISDSNGTDCTDDGTRVHTHTKTHCATKLGYLHYFFSLNFALLGKFKFRAQVFKREMRERPKMRTKRKKAFGGFWRKRNVEYHRDLLSLPYDRRVTNDVGTENWDKYQKPYTRARSNVHGEKRFHRCTLLLNFWASFYFQLILFISLLNFAPKECALPYRTLTKRAFFYSFSSSSPSSSASASFFSFAVHFKRNLLYSMYSHIHWNSLHKNLHKIAAVFTATAAATFAAVIRVELNKVAKRVVT